MRTILYASIITVLLTIVLAIVRLHVAAEQSLHCQLDGIILLTSLAVLFWLRAVIRFRKANVLHKKTNILVSLAFLAGPVTIFLIQFLQIFVDNDMVSKTAQNNIIYCVVLMFMVYTGNYAIAAKNDGCIGHRNPWSLSHHIIWAKTQRFYGKYLLISSLVTVPLAVFLEQITIATLILLTIYLLAYICSMLYSLSYYHYFIRDNQYSQ